MQTLDDLRAYCSKKPGYREDFPFDHYTLTLKVMSKVFAISNINETPTRVNLKCEPELAELLREKYDAVIPGYHMNKKHWNTVTLDGSVPESELLFLIDMSYDLVVKGLKKSDRDKLTALKKTSEGKV